MLEPPPEVLAIAARLERAGFETWCVGGAVRDALLGLPSVDWDLATAARPEDVRRVFRRTVPKGIQFGTIGVLDRHRRVHEVTTFRRDIHTDGRHAVVEFGASLDEDLARRDFTINAIAYSPSRGVIHDPFGGRADLDRRLVRAVGVAAARMREDWLRALRAIRFAARFEFDIEPETWEAVAASAPFLTRLSRERVREELEKLLLQARRPARGLELWRRSGALRVLIPPIADQSAVVFAALDCIAAPTALERRRDGRLSARLATLFLGLPGEVVSRTLRGLRFSNSRLAYISHLADAWLALQSSMDFAGVSAGPSDATLRRWAAVAGRPDIAMVLRVAAALWTARRATGDAVPAAGQVRHVYRRAVRAAYTSPVEVADLAIDGEDLLELGVPPGPFVGAILRALLDRVVEDPSLNTREQLLALAAMLWRRLDSQPPEG